MPPSPRASRQQCFAGISLVMAALAGALAHPATAQGPPGIRVDDSAVGVTENGGTYTQKVWLFVAPTGDVTVQVASGDTSVVTVNPTTLTFTAANYNIEQEVTYTAVDDSALNFPPRHRQNDGHV